MKRFSKILAYSLVFIIAACAVMIVSFVGTAGTASGTLELFYEGAAEGLNPNGTRLRIRELESDEFLEKVASLLDGGSIPAESLRNCLSIDALNAVSGHTSASYRISVDCRKDDAAAAHRPEDVLQAFFTAFEEDFNGKYCSDTLAACRFDHDAASKLEYWDFLELIETKIGMLKQHLEQLKEESGTSQNWISGESFTSVSNAVDAFSDHEIRQFESYLTRNSVYRDVSSYQNRLRYDKLILCGKYRCSSVRYETLKQVLTDYDVSMITYVMVPMYGRNGAYMTRTVTGIDSFAEEMLDYSNYVKIHSLNLADLNRKLVRTTGSGTTLLNNYGASDWFTARLKSTANVAGVTAEADRMEEALIGQYDRLIERAEDSIEACRARQQENTFTCSICETTVRQRLGIKKALAAGAAFCVIAYLAATLLKKLFT